MRIQDRFTVNVPLQDVWNVLLDIERIAPCMPGAQLQDSEGDEYRGIVKVKLGAITAQFKGVARFQEVDEAARRVVLRAEGREMRGQGSADATVTARLEESDAGGTDLMIDTDLKISGRVAQFGRGVMADVSTKLLGEFARCLEQDLLSGDTRPAAATAGAGGASGTGVGQGRTVEGPEVEPLDLMAAAGSSVAERALPAALVLVLLLLAASKKKAARWILAIVGAALVGAREVSARRT
ncbi:MAG TPA: SRPBCC family protein [Egibacteraceae bacterium]|nr:SRPBCC family protein [Egibacteraceae bacterium]